MGPRKPGESERDEDYVNKRARNNEAVKRSREKAKQKAKETTDRVTKLKQENEKLEERIKLLSKELTFLKDIFLAHAGTANGLSLDDMDLKSLLREDDTSVGVSATNDADQEMSQRHQDRKILLINSSSSQMQHQ